MNHLLWTPHGWYYRRRVPIELQKAVGKLEIKKSLKTLIENSAIERSRQLDKDTTLLFRTLRTKLFPERIDFFEDVNLLAEELQTTGDRLRDRGYYSETVTLIREVMVDNCTVQRVVFAISQGEKVLCHLIVVSPAGKKGLLCSRKRGTPGEWAALAEVLAEMKTSWRHKKQ